MAKKTDVTKLDKLSTEVVSALDGKSLEVKEAALNILSEVFNKIKLTLSDSAQVIKEGLLAETVLVETQWASEQRIPDHNVRLKAAMLHLELLGLLKGKSSTIGDTNVNVLQVNQILEQLKVVKPLATKTIVVKRTNDS